MYMIRRLAVSVLLLSCTGKDTAGTIRDDSTRDTSSGADSGGADSDDSAASWDEARPIIEARCSRCHSADRLSTYRRLETHAEVTALRSSILDKIGDSPPRGQRMPLASNHTSADGCTPEHAQLNDKRLTEAEKATLASFLQRTDHLDYGDTYPPLEAPEVALLPDAEVQTSAPFEVLNDGFLEHPDGADTGYMSERGYDEREYDQMEDDWYCIRFDPARTEAGYLTGVQALTDSGQIFLGAQLVIDTTGASAAAQAASAEQGDDWYRCDGGLGFSDAIPLWRTVPGSEAITLPEGTGLRFEPGWSFVLRADFHTHFDADEFKRLDQDGVIDYDAGTMTWNNRATLRTRWAAPEDIDRELSWLIVGPSTPAERDAFSVAPGQSVLSYTASVPAAAGVAYAVFSAEVGMGKLGHAASLVETAASSCVASNTDFSPKWIEQALYAEDDAPTLDAGSTLELRCSYRNGTSDSVTWDGEGEATVWGRKERCSAVVFYYPRR